MSTSTSNLDLTKVESTDFEQLAKRIESFYRDDSAVKASLSYNWERNHMMLDGKQWIVYDGDKGRNGQWRSLQVTRANEYIPRPVTNYIFDAYQTLKSYLIQNKPRSTVQPNTQDYQDKTAAQIANLVVEANWDRLQEEKNYEYAAACGVTYGTVFKKDFWDTSTLTMAKVPKVDSKPEIGPDGQPTGQMQEVEARDPQTGEPLFDYIPLGDVNTAIIEPYRLAIDPLATDLHTARWVMEYSIQPLDYIEEMYDKQGVPGYTGLFADVKSETSLSGSMQRFYNLKNSSGTKGSAAVPGSGAGSSDTMIENAAVLKEYYERPSRKYPKGRMIVVANKVVLYSGDSPCEGLEMGDWHPYSEFRWEVVPGRFWGRGPLDDAVELQKHINSIDAAIILVRKTMAIPQKLIPKDAGIAPGAWTGRPGQEVYYRANGSVPTTIAASGVDTQVFQERKQKVEDLKQITGAIDILKGDRPAGVTAASALELLFEVGTGKLRPGLDRWKKFVEGSQKKQLRLVSQKYREPRPEFIRLLQSKNKDLPKEAINEFIGKDLYGNCNVIIEAGSNIPKLLSAEKSQLLQLAQVGSLDLDSPQNRMEFNRRFGVTGFDRDVGPDTKRAEWENDLLDNIMFSHGNKPVVLADENHQLHLQTHLDRMKAPAFLALDESIQQAYMQHMSEHQNYVDMQQQQAMETAAATGQPPAPPQNSMQGPPARPHGKGISKDQQDALASDITRK